MRGKAHGKIELERQIEVESEFFLLLLRDEFELWMKAQVRIRLFRSDVHITLSASHAIIALRIPLKPLAIRYRTSTQNQTPRGIMVRTLEKSREGKISLDESTAMDAPTPASSGAEWSVGVSADCWCSVAGSKSRVARPASGCGGVRGETGRRGPSPHPAQQHSPGFTAASWVVDTIKGSI